MQPKSVFRRTLAVTIALLVVAGMEIPAISPVTAAAEDAQMNAAMGL